MATKSETSDPRRKPFSDILELVEGRKTGVSHLVDKTGIDESTIITVLQMLSNLVLPNSVFNRLKNRGATTEQTCIAEIAFRDICTELILQHAGVSTVKDGRSDQKDQK